MIALAVGAGLLVVAVGVLAVALWLIREARRFRVEPDRQHARELAMRDARISELLDRLAHERGNAWTLPPSWEHERDMKERETLGPPDFERIHLFPESMVLSSEEIGDDFDEPESAL